MTELQLVLLQAYCLTITNFFKWVIILKFKKASAILGSGNQYINVSHNVLCNNTAKMGQNFSEIRE